jgi:hypothetical protein
MKVICDHPNTGEIIVLKNGYVFKVSKKRISDKIRNEAVFYENLRNFNCSIKKYFPKFYCHETGNQTNKIKLEYLKDYKSLSSYILRNDRISLGVMTKTAKQIRKAIALFAKNKIPDHDRTKLFEQYYFMRPKERLSELYEKSFFRNLKKFEKVYINGRAYDNIEIDYFHTF